MMLVDARPFLPEPAVPSWYWGWIGRVWLVSFGGISVVLTTLSLSSTV